MSRRMLTSVRLFLSRPWRKFKKGSVLVIEVWPFLSCLLICTREMVGTCLQFNETHNAAAVTLTTHIECCMHLRCSGFCPLARLYPASQLWRVQYLCCQLHDCTCSMSTLLSPLQVVFNSRHNNLCAPILILLCRSMVMWQSRRGAALHRP